MSNHTHRASKLINIRQAIKPEELESENETENNTWSFKFIHLAYKIPLFSHLTKNERLFDDFDSNLVR